MRNRYPTNAQNAVFADHVGQSLLKEGRDCATFTYLEFYALVQKFCHCEKYDESMMRRHFRESVLGGSVEFVISFGTNIVFVAKDSNFAPVEI
jgi:hypothetical protein